MLRQRMPIGVKRERKTMVLAGKSEVSPLLWVLVALALGLLLLVPYLIVAQRAFAGL